VITAAAYADAIELRVPFAPNARATGAGGGGAQAFKTVFAQHTDSGGRV
jgi:hypothetical protein